MSTKDSPVTLDKIVALCKRRGFAFQAGEIYGGLNGVYEFGHLGVLLKDNIKKAWLRSLYQTSPHIVQLEGALLGLHSMWEASGHTQNFSDPMVDCTQCKHRYRVDEINLNKPCPHCGKTAWTEPRQFNMMFQTQVGAAADHSSIAYLRPETAQHIFVNFKNVLSSHRVNLPFGIAQIGKAFRNEVTPKQFLFRVREFEQMELEWFCKPDDAAHYFDLWASARIAFYATIGIKQENIRTYTQAKEDLAHYSSQCIDIEYQFPFGWKELEGVADRGNFDLTQHSTHSGKELAVYNQEEKKSIIPHVIESSVGVDRLFLALLCDAYKEDIVDDQPRTVLALSPRMAPIKAAILPLVKKLNEPAYTLYKKLVQTYMVEFDDSGSIGKRYRRQDEIGTPLCFTYDFESEESGTVTMRSRDTTEQVRIPMNKIEQHIAHLLA